MTSDQRRPAGEPMRVGVIGAGAMGAGIAQVAAVAWASRAAGRRVAGGGGARARRRTQSAMARDVEKGRRTRADADAAAVAHHATSTASARAADGACRLRLCDRGDHRAACGEAGAVPRARSGRAPATRCSRRNTSSLSIAALAGACRHARARDRRAFLQSGAGHAAGGDHSGDLDRRRTSRRPRRAGRRRGARPRCIAKDTPGFHRESHRAPVLRRVAAHARRRAGRRRDDRLGDDDDSADFAWGRSR